MDGQYEASGRLFQTLVRTQPDSIAYQGYLGAIAARLGHRAEALRISQSIEGLDPPFVHGAAGLWQARIAAALGDREAAVRLLRRSEAEGRRFDGTEEITVDFQELRDYQPFRDWLAPRPTR
jgi:predicted Zn-dependent protease